MALDAFKQEVEAAFEDFKTRFESAKAAVEAEVSERVDKVADPVVPAPEESEQTPVAEPPVEPVSEGNVATPVEPPVTDENGNPVGDPNAAR